MRSSLTRVWREGAVVVCVAISLAACGASPTDTTNSSANGGGSSDDLGFGSVYAAVKDLTGEARQQKLIELAKAEGGEVSAYHSGDLTPEFADFTAKTGIKVKDFQTTNEQVNQRVLQEAQAGHPGSDVLDSNAGGLTILNDAKAIAPLQTPNLAQINPQYTGITEPNQIPLYGIMKMPAYHTGQVKAADLPQSWDELFQSYNGNVGIEQTDWSWYATLVTKWFVAKKGMSESDAIKLITNGLKGVTAVNGHPLEAQLLASGQYGLALTFYGQFMPALQAKKAPIAFYPNNDQMPPLLTIANNAALTAHAPHPAAALLLVEYLTGVDGQKQFANQGYIPAIKDFPGDTLLKQYPNPLIDDAPAQPQAYEQKWEDAFDTLLQSVGGKKIDKAPSK
jgi:iron(III) transport system substrate-binding protein